MTLRVKIDKSEITLGLVTKRKIIDSETFLYYHDLSDLLISKLDKLLQRNSIDASAIKSFKIQENIGENSTSYKIVAAFIEGLKAKI